MLKLTLHPDQEAVARRCLQGAESNSVTFPEIVRQLSAAGFESYVVDLRRGAATYYLPNGESVECGTHSSARAVAPDLNADALQQAIREAQTGAPGYTYLGFCEKAKAAGVAGYLVSISGRRVLYWGRTAAVHVEHFPTAS
jgi:uncharacterized protein YbcV (DUF1398 family)